MSANNKPRICKSCAQPIEGDHIRALKADWHPEHFCCLVCQKPIIDGRFYIHESTPCHPACYEENIAPHCAICDKALLRQHHINGWGDHYCLEHAQELASCNYCGRLVPHITQKMVRREQLHIRCEMCATTGIEDTEQALALMPILIDWFEAQGTRFRQKKFRIEVLDQEGFAEREGGRRDPLGLTMSTRYMRNKRIDHAKVDSVAILQGLPFPLFAGVCVHELGHVWLVQQNIVNLPIVDEEGFCELMAYRYHMESGSETDEFYARRTAENSSPVYGAGFRKLHQLEARVGFEQIIKSLLRKKKLPL